MNEKCLFCGLRKTCNVIYSVELRWLSYRTKVFKHSSEYKCDHDVQYIECERSISEVSAVDFYRVVSFRFVGDDPREYPMLLLSLCHKEHSHPKLDKSF